MRVLGLFLLIIILCVLIVGSKNSAQSELIKGVATAADSNTQFGEKLNKIADSTFGNMGNQLGYFKDNVGVKLENSLNTMVKQVTSDATNMITSITNTAVAMQIINSFKGLNKEGQLRVKEAVCQ